MRKLRIACNGVHKMMKCGSSVELGTWLPILQCIADKGFSGHPPCPHRLFVHLLNVLSRTPLMIIIVFSLLQLFFHDVCYGGFVEEELHRVYTEGCNEILSDLRMLSYRDTVGIGKGDRLCYCTALDEELRKRFGPVSEALSDIGAEAEAENERMPSYGTMCMTLGKVSRQMNARDVRKLLYLLGEIGSDRDSDADHVSERAIYLAYTMGRMAVRNLSLDLLLGWSIESNKDKKRTDRYRGFLRGLLTMDESFALRVIRSVPEDAIEALMIRCRREIASQE